MSLICPRGAIQFGLHPWSFAALEPAMAKAGDDLFRAFTIGYLATVRRDQYPRVHPVSIALAAGGLYATIVSTTRKVNDLRRDGRYALHAFPRIPTPESWVDEEFMVGGKAREAADMETRIAVLGTEANVISSEHLIFELDVSFAFHKSRDEKATPLPAIFVADRGATEAPPSR